MTIRALIFDFDGLIVDTELPEYTAWQEVYKQHNASLPLELWARVLGASYTAFDPAAHLQQMLAYPVDLNELHEHHNSIADQQIQSLEPLPGVRQLIIEASMQGIRLGVASSSHRDWVAGKLELFGLLPYFQSIWTATEITNVKPAPDLYQHCLRSLGAEPHEGIALEDSPNGITAAKAAGMHCVAVPNLISSQLSLDHADWIIPSLASVSLDQLIGRFNGNGHLPRR